MNDEIRYDIKCRKKNTDNSWSYFGGAMTEEAARRMAKQCRHDHPTLEWIIIRHEVRTLRDANGDPA